MTAINTFKKQKSVQNLIIITALILLRLRRTNNVLAYITVRQRQLNRKSYIDTNVDF